MNDARSLAVDPEYLFAGRRLGNNHEVEVWKGAAMMMNGCAWSWLSMAMLTFVSSPSMVTAHYKGDSPHWQVTPEEVGTAITPSGRAANVRLGPWHGGPGGFQGYMRCDDDSVAVGLDGMSGDVIDQLTLVCARLQPDGSLGARYPTPSIGGPGGFPFSLRCADGYALEAVYGRSGRLIDAVGIRCKTLDGLRGYTGGRAGGSGGVPFWDSVGSDEFLVGLDGRAGDYVDGFQAMYGVVR